MPRCRFLQYIFVLDFKNLANIWPYKCHITNNIGIITLSRARISITRKYIALLLHFSELAGASY